MLITTQNEILSLMPTAKWDRPQQLFGYIEEEEAVALEPLLGNSLYQWLLGEYDRLRGIYTDITATTVRPTGKAKEDARLGHADVTERLEQISQGRYREIYEAPEPGEKDVPEEDLHTIRLIRICQQIEFYRMIAHKAGMLTVSFNEGGGMNVVTADNYDAAEEKAKDRVVKDAFMSAGRAVDSLLLFLEADAKDQRQYTDMWSEADAFYLNKDLLFQTAQVLQKFLPVAGRLEYVELVRDIRFCQMTYIRPAIGDKLLKAVVAFANTDPRRVQERVVREGEDFTIKTEKGKTYRSGGQARSYSLREDGEPEIKVDTDARRSTGKVRSITIDKDGDMGIHVDKDEQVPEGFSPTAGDELLEMLRQALAFFVETRSTKVGPKGESLARRDSMNDARQALAMACDYIEEHLDSLGEAAVDTPIYNSVREKEKKQQWEQEHRQQAECRRRREACRQTSRKLFTAFPHTHRDPELK